MKTLQNILLTILLSYGSATYGQITIGSSYEPARGALLDLKNQADGTSTLRLMLPRVALKDLTKLTMGDNEIADMPTQSGTSTEWVFSGADSVH